MKRVKVEDKLLRLAYRKPSTLFRFIGSPPYFYFRFRLYGHRDGRFCLIFARTAQQSVLDGKNGRVGGCRGENGSRNMVATQKIKRALMTSYRPSIVTSSILTRFRDIAAFVLQHATFSHPTSSLPRIFPCSPWNRWMIFGLRRAKMLG